MKVLILSHEYPPVAGGGGIAAHEIARGLALRGHEPWVVTAAVPGTKREADPGVRLIEIKAGRCSVRSGTFLHFLRFMVGGFAAGLRNHREVRFDRALAIFAAPAGIVAWGLRLATGLPYLVRIRGADVPGYYPGRLSLLQRLLGELARPVWRRASAVVATGALLKERAAREHREARLQLIPWGVDLQRFRPDEPKPLDQPPPALPLRLLTVASLTPKKGLSHLIEAVRILTRDGQDVDLDVVGTGPEERRLSHAIEQAALTGRARLVGVVASSFLPGWYRRADAFVLPSVAESFSSALLEALASGLPVVATDVGEARSLVREEWNGFLVPPGDAEALAAALSRLACLPAGQRQGMGARSREIAEIFGWDAIVQRYLSLLCAK